VNLTWPFAAMRWPRGGYATLPLLPHRKHKHKGDDRR